MSDGIIQKIFKELYDEVVIDEISVYRIKSLEQKIIDTIQLEIGHMTLEHKCTVSELHPYDILHKLIGGNSNE